MITLRRLSLFLACLLAVGSILPDVSRWQCHHAARMVNTPFATLPPLMPCRMGTPMPGMACCPPAPLAAKALFPTRQALSRPACHPTLTRLTALPAPAVQGARVLLRHSLLSAQAALPLPAMLLPPVPLFRAFQPRPLPDVPLCASAPAYAPGLRAPPLS